MLASRRALVLALSALVALARGPIGSLAIESKCTACAAVAAELGGALEAERPRNHLDLRGRLDSKGQRYGKLIDYKVSELRFVELLENLCEDVASGYGYSVGVWRKGSKPKGAQGKAMRAELSLDTVIGSWRSRKRRFRRRCTPATSTRPPPRTSCADSLRPRIATASTG